MLHASRIVDKALTELVPGVLAHIHFSISTVKDQQSFEITGRRSLRAPVYLETVSAIPFKNFKCMEMEERLDGIEKTLGRIENVLIGDEKYRQQGMVDRLHKVEKYQERDKLREAKRSGVTIVISAVGAALMSWFMGKTH